jgi:hypothetical protein
MREVGRSIDEPDSAAKLPEPAQPAPEAPETPAADGARKAGDAS